ncbi:MAG: glutathione S-transferase family protein [Pseudomonadota bacterium]|nr:glutathione S-transferase family protein [Pseudomonadota bacterium]
MPRLHHLALDPFSRRIRIALAEYGIEAELLEERPGNATAGLLALSPEAVTPVFVDDDGAVACGIEAVSEYLEETRGPAKFTLLGATPVARAETRRLVAWFDRRLGAEVSEPLLDEKVTRRFLTREQGGGPPDTARIRHAQGHIAYHLDYIGALAEARNWLAGDSLSAADLAAAAHLSCIDFLGEIAWSTAPAAKLWYQRIKSRPSFRPLLADHVRGMTPHAGYANLDF